MNNNPELVQQLRAISSMNSTEDYLKLMRILAEARNNTRNKNVTNTWLSAIHAVDQFANLTVTVLEVSLKLHREIVKCTRRFSTVPLSRFDNLQFSFCPLEQVIQFSVIHVYNKIQ